jgi:hypothetical protein
MRVFPNLSVCPNKRLQNDRQIATRFSTLALLGGI